VRPSDLPNPKVPKVVPPWTGAPCLHRPSRGTTWVEKSGAKPPPMQYKTRRANKTVTVSMNHRPHEANLSGHSTAPPAPLYLNSLFKTKPPRS